MGDRTERFVDAGLMYGPRDPVRVRIIHRDGRISVTDDGAAIARAGRPPGWRAAAHRVSEQLVVNIRRDGVISLPVVRVGPGEERIVERIAEASLSLYQDILDLRD